MAEVCDGQKFQSVQTPAIGCKTEGEPFMAYEVRQSFLHDITYSCNEQTIYSVKCAKYALTE